MSTRRQFLQMLSLLPLSVALSHRVQASTSDHQQLRLHKGWVIKASDLKQAHQSEH